MPTEDFDAVFDEITSEQQTTDESGVTTGSTEPEAVEQEQQTAQDKPLEDNDQGDGDKSQEVFDRPSDPVDPSDVDYKALYEREVQRTKSWGGRLRKADQIIKDLQTQLEQHQAKVGQPKEGGQAPGAQGGSHELEAFIKEFPELERPIRQLIQQEVSTSVEQVLGQVDQRYAPVVQAVQQVSSSAHERAIAEAHPDYRDLATSGVVLRWIENQPPYIAESLRRVYDGGTTADVIDMLHRFKRATGFAAPKPQSNPAVSSRKQQKMQALSAVPGSSSSPPKPQKKSEDFDSAWEEATRAG